MPSLLPALAENPALPAELLQRLVDAAPEDEDLAWALAHRTDLSAAQARALAALHEDSPYLLAGLGVPVDDPLARPDLALALLDQGRGRPEWALPLARHPDRDTRVRLAGCPGLPDQAAELLAADEEPEVAAELAYFTGRADLLRALAGHPAFEVRRGVAANEATPPDLLAALAADEEPEVRSLAAGNPATPGTAAARLLAEPDAPPRQQLAAHPHLPAEAYRRLAEDESPWVRAELAENPAVDEAVLRRLATDDDPDVRRRLTRNPRIPLDLLAELAVTVRVGATLLDRVAAATPAELTTLAASPEPRVRMLAAEHRDLPAAVRDRLAEDPDAAVAKSVAPHPGLTAARLTALHDRFGGRVAHAVARNPDAPTALLDRIATAEPPAAKALRAIAQHPHAGRAALTACLTAPHPTSSYAAANPALPADVMAALIHSA
ncbi:hypothetical protein [Streptomyces rubellomurinus]|uniref:hypothetical protein n=1 Tax=Streptomyces rubellomurinus (strain ATCC 31215) TaxID=359131 RepID=UPI0006979633|nr:hypothetical protein [Streptomyces rubellomurinus]